MNHLNRHYWLVLIVLFLVCLEIVRRVFSYAYCYVEHRYNPEVFGVTHERLLTECWNRHIIFPFGIFIPSSPSL